MSRENQHFTYVKKKGLISFAVTTKLISTFVFATQIVQFLYFLNPKFPASSHLLCLYSSICVGPVRKPHCWFSHDVAYVWFEKEVHVHVLFEKEYRLIHSHLKHMSRLVGKPTMRFPNRSDTNRPVQAQKRARSLKFRN